MSSNGRSLLSTLWGHIGTWTIPLLVVGATLGLPASRVEAAVSPDALVTGMTEQVLTTAGRSRTALDPATMQTLVETIIMPNVDFRGMTARAVGPRWRAADDAQKAQLKSGFEALLIRTYAGALSQAYGATFRLKPGITIDSTTREVRSEVTLRNGGDPIVLNYRLSLQGEDWKVTDVSVMGVWLVPTYQSQFAEVLQNTGVDGLIQALAEKGRPR